MTHLDQKELLQNLGLNDREVVIYEALLNKGPLLPQSVAKETGIKRSTLYTLFPEMISKGYLIEIALGKRYLLQAVSPDKLYDLYEKKYKEVKSGIVELLAAYRMQGMKPKVEVYEGLEGIKQVFIDILEENKDMMGFNRIAKYDKELLNWVLNYFVPKRIKKGIEVKAIVTREKEGQKNMESGKEYRRETRFVPLNKFPFTATETWVYSNKICFMTIKENGPLTGVIIESKDISQNIRSLFELAWEAAEKHQGQ